MSITQRNLYLPAQNLSNLSVNVDDNRLGNDQTEISVNFGTTPATVTVKVGSVIEVNGNSYVIDTSDEVFQMANATDNYITFTDNPSPTFGSASSVGTFDAQKQGYYQAGNTTRTLKWYIDQSVSVQDFYIDYAIFLHQGQTGFQDNAIVSCNKLAVNDTYFTENITRVTGSGASSPVTINLPSGYTEANTNVLTCQVNPSSPVGVYCLGQYQSIIIGCRILTVGPNVTASITISGIISGPYSVVLIISRP